ncbi:zinc ribbon domain-containing protein [uncultured Methanoregula sp.]|uniref:zinc ribbon domain-containing protein n=1 Tax=uncultured Methanoregula sp. TaxID=1005933 RepID=UPI002AAB3214|nr:zinc ribbon domain-containing protein [uncultured Methanoregula sp.]
MITCEACGGSVSAGTSFCTACGARLSRETDNLSHDTIPSPAVPEEGLVWSRKIPLITNPYLVLQCIGIPFLIGIVLGGLFSLGTGSRDMLLLFLVIALGLAVLMLIIMAVLQLVTGGGLETDFFISSNGVAHSAGKTTRTLDRASTAGSVVLGSMGGTGTGLIAMSQECNVLAWQDVRYISGYPAVRSLVFRSKYLISPVVLYCTEENFPQVRALVKKYAPAVAAAKL